jgi:hypothetical protein
MSPYASTNFARAYQPGDVGTDSGQLLGDPGMAYHAPSISTSARCPLIKQDRSDVCGHDERVMPAPSESEPLHVRMMTDDVSGILRRDKRARIAALCGRSLRSTVRTGQIAGDIDEPGPDASAFWSAGVWVWWN